MEAARRVAEHLAEAPEFRACRRLVLYAALPGEIPLDLVWVRARREGKRVLFPRMVSASELVLAEAACVEELRPGRYGVPEPIAEASAEPLGDDSLVLVPGVAFDPTGGRLGRGRGAWDRALGERGGAGVFGVAFEFQVIDLVPREAHDRPVDALLTEAGIRRVSRP